MYQAKWKDKTFSITSNTIRTLTELGASYKVKKKTDGTSSITYPSPLMGEGKIIIAFSTTHLHRQVGLHRF